VISLQQKIRLLIVEDEQAIRNGLIDVFVYHGYEVTAHADGQEGLDAALDGDFDLILLDVMLPRKNGFDICEAIRQVDRDQPIIMLTAKTADDDIIRGLSLGADDYVAKPFSVAQLVLRVQAVLRRSQNVMQQQQILYLYSGLEIDTANLCAMVKSKKVSFTRREIDVLHYLYLHSTRPVPRDELLHKVWGYAKDMDIETRTVDIHIAKLRRKIELDPKIPVNLITVRGGGYRLQVAT